jgi:hypothetical protein
MVSRRRFLAAAAGAASLSLAGCLDGSAPPVASDARDAFAVPAGDGHVHLHASANPVVEGTTDLREARRTVAYLGGTPRWVAGVPDGAASLWAVVLDDASVLGFRVTRDGVERVPASPSRLQYGTLPVVADASDASGVELRTDPWTTDHSHPVRVDDAVATVLGDGRVSVRRGDDRRLADVDALPDARPVAADGRVAVLAGRTTDYPHGALGDDVEAEAVALVSAAGDDVARLSPPGADAVLEGTAPIAADVDGDGEAEFVTAAADAADGARIVVLDVSGDHRVGPAVGDGFRWRHPLAVAPFGPNGELEVAAVKTPHVGGVAEFYRPGSAGDDLELVAESAGGYGTHAFGSRNLGGAVAGRLAGDDRWCLLVPAGFGGDLTVLRRTRDGVASVGAVAPPAARTTNLAAVGVRGGADTAGGGAEEDADGDGGVHLVVGTDDGLAVWTG